MSEKEKFELRISGDECEKIARSLKQEYDKDNSKDKKNYKKVIKKFLGRHFFTIFALIIICKYFCFALRYTHPIFLYYFKNVIPALVASIGVFEGFKYNRRQAYKEIVTRERINWLHKIQENLALYLELTSYHDKKGKKSRQEKPDKVKSVRDKDYKSPERLYHEILFNINHNKDAKAKIALENYHRAYKENWEGFQGGQAYKDIYIELEVCPEEEDKKTFKIKDIEELSKKIRGNTPKSKEELRKEVEEEFTNIFKEVWKDIKEEAD
ncbi:MAG: hypothetical protein E7A44_04665 [Peptoniphilus harei]|nr:hypothetical protein [Peptoniphilus harei]MDU1023191.1 hypothetical protein [Peptoniphilus harei]